MALEQTSAHDAYPEIKPPNSGPLRRNTHTYELIRQCIHCGFCLPTCPTYSVLGVEMDSPRGRIYQMQAVAEGRLEIGEDFVEHMNCCVGCRACETACPSGVQFGKLIEAAREQIQLAEEDPNASTQITGPSEHMQVPAQKTLAGKLLHRIFFDYMLPSHLNTMLVFSGLKVYQRSGLQTLVHRTGLLDLVNNLPTPFKGKLKLPEELMASASGDIFPAQLPEITHAIGARKYRVGFISGCIMDQVFRDINEASIRVLAANGCEVITPVQQGCCGALHVHGGEAERGRDLARHNIDIFEQYNCDVIIINSAGCGSTLKEYDHLLRDDPAYAERAKAFSGKVKDISEFLVSIKLNQQMGEVTRTVAYHDACHLAHGQKIKQQPRQLLQTIPGIQLTELKEADWCCGSAGVYNIVNQKMGNELLERKMENVAATEADIVATGNPGCMMQIAMGVRQRNLDMQVVHPIQLLDEAYRVGGLYRNAQRPDLNNLTASTKHQQKQRFLFVGIVLGLLLGLFFLGRRKK
ncbi:(Fe-S)-binding protein [Ktedonospora formicarum]|uniref:Glycolate oxidase iron-sulfur subunit n=1 Tax=Ktedonospora formicarum TaxID=2778364 RepID=A0A8J3MYU4_9CHLR|nr:heterodisulfide reductase-related iron-sulfur binding cluster [Ktedonospora formicarum]GHO50045.1 glycolate oxidase iron-sulfur subunit [Ktedonospora formicarum]